MARFFVTRFSLPTLAPLLCFTAGIFLATLCIAASNPVSQPEDSPRLVYQAFQKAVNQQDWMSAYHMQTDASKEEMLAGLIMQAKSREFESADQQAQLMTLLAKSGVDPEAQPEITEQDANFRPLLKGVKDRTRLMADLVGWLKANPIHGSGGFPKLGELKTVNRRGGKATLVVDTERGWVELQLIQENSRWRLNLTQNPKPAKIDPSVPALGKIEAGNKTIDLRDSLAFISQDVSGESTTTLLLLERPLSPLQKQTLQDQLNSGEQVSLFDLTQGGSHVQVSQNKQKKRDVSILAENVQLTPGEDKYELSFHDFGDEIVGQIMMPAAPGHSHARVEAVFQAKILRQEETAQKRCP